MDTDVRGRSFSIRTRKGFAIAEVLIAIGLVAVAALIVGGLGQQVLNLAKSSKQTAASIELRTKTNSISRNLDSWLGKMRSSLETNGLYAACIPDPSSASSLFKCPAVDAALLDSDAELKRIAGTQLHAVSAPVIDLLGERIAGTVEEPLYLDLDGRKCQQTNQLNCPLKSTGFFLRSNPAIDSTPGSVRFVVKIEANRASEQIKGTAPQRTQYLSIDVGSEWQQVVGVCPAGAIKIGYLASGSPNCIHPTKKCAAGTVALGLDNSANPICATPPAACVSGGAVVDTASNTLVCSASSPCSSNQIFLGYYSGTGTPMCSGTNISCPDGQVQTGIQGTTGSLTALCKTLPSCQDSQKLSYDGSQFVCQSATVASNCNDGEVVVGINTDGSAKCQPAERTLASTNLSCKTGEYVAGLESDGTVKCERLPASNSGATGSDGGGASGGNILSVWEDIPLNNTDEFETECEYRFKVNARSSSIPEFNEETFFIANIVNRKAIGHNSYTSYVIKANKKSDLWGLWNQNDTSVNLTSAWGRRVTLLQKNCTASAPKSNAVRGSCTIEATVVGARDTRLKITNSATSSGSCSLSSYGSSQGSSTPLSASPGQSVTGSSPSSPWPFQLDPYVSCPAETTKSPCAFESGSGPLGKIVCSCN